MSKKYHVKLSLRHNKKDAPRQPKKDRSYQLCLNKNDGFSSESLTIQLTP